jgi:hypothetical protein
MLNGKGGLWHEKADGIDRQAPYESCGEPSPESAGILKRIARLLRASRIETSLAIGEAQERQD